MEKIKILLYFGYHDHVDDALDAINEIKKTSKHLQNKNKILIIEKSGWAYGFKTIQFTDELDDQQYRDRLVLIENEYNKWINKIEDGIPLEESEINWPTTIYKFGFENNYITLFELVNPKITKELFKCQLRNDDQFMLIQFERDRFLVEKQVLPLIKKYPEKTILIVRGGGHEKILPNILNNYKIFYKIVKYDSERSKLRRKEEGELFEKEKNDLLEKLWSDIKKEEK